MPRLKLLEDLEDVTTRRLSRPRIRVAAYDASSRAESGPIPQRFEHRIGVRLAIVMTGDAADTPHMIRHARRAIADAVYGDVSRELRVLLEELWAEGFGPQERPVKRLLRLLDLLDGYDVPEDLKDY